MTLAGTLELVRGFRRRDADTPDRADGLLQPDLPLRRRALSRRREGRRRRRPDRRRSAARGGRRALPAGAGAGPVLHPPRDADHRRSPPAQGARATPAASSTTSRSTGITGRRRAGGRPGRPGGRAPAPPHQPAGRGRLRHPHRASRRPRSPRSPMPRWSARRWSTGSRARSTSRAAPRPASSRALHEQVQALAEGVRGARR